jgi:hypothetical protein
VKCLLVAAILLADAAYCAVPDAKSLIAESIDAYEHDWRAGMCLAYTQTDTIESENGRNVEVSEIGPLAGPPYERLIRRNGQPLTAAEQRKSDEKYEDALKHRTSESPAERQARIKKYADQRAFLRDVPKAFEFSLLGEDPVNGRPAWVVALKPLFDFVPETPHGEMLKHIAGKLWIDKETVHWVKAEVYVLDPISIGWKLGRIGSGTEISLDMERVMDDVWMPKQIAIYGRASVLVAHRKDRKEQIIFAGYHSEGAQSLTAVGESIRSTESDSPPFEPAPISCKLDKSPQQ